MKFFLDSANLDALRKYKNIVDGVTTNPAIMAKEKASQESRLKEICATAPVLPISGEVVYANSVEQICDDARKIGVIAPNIVIKIPGNLYGLQAIRILKAEGFKLNVTALMTFKQLALAAQQGADYVSQFYCRAKDAGVDSVSEINKAKEFIVQNGLKAEIIIGSLRTTADVESALLTRGDILTISPELLELCFAHPKTQSSIEEFAQRYEAATKS
jgi:TalC/MipB family fructose-6-phosphate aldolase